MSTSYLLGTKPISLYFQRFPFKCVIFSDFSFSITNQEQPYSSPSAVFLMENKKKVSFGNGLPSESGDENPLVVFNKGASDAGARHRKRSRAASRVSMGSATSDEEGTEVLAPGEAVVSLTK